MRGCYYQKLDNAYLAVIDLFPLGSDVWEVSRINVPARYRGQGIGSRLMDQLLEDADAEGVTLQLTINPYGGLTYEQLQDWYERRGFVQSRDVDGYIFIREPEG